MIETILPAGVASAELFTYPEDLQPHPAEEHLIANSVEKRRRDFIGARYCARQALAQLGEPPVAIGKGDRGAPIWPRGVVGSLTHCDGYRAAALAHRLRFRSVGIDAEPHDTLPAGVLDSVSLPAEREWLRSTDSGLHLDRLLFCAKEATYKAWFPLTGRWLGFEDAHITFTIDEAGADTGRGTFRSDLLVSGQTADGGFPLTSFDGRWQIGDGLILTAIVHR
ncbi:4'-phosphopantetheinyl transferase Npt [Nocardia donostiensis]|uniref:4'-phosphopantetheinyl transferase n=1 Tax=Nocardia donostiensis TaxID=1538463 RepID=A0A1V2TEA3_9NOCA|nr:4'-phosphopantetheinyl transferase Npt [Nocardia donostiensis]ONM47823.1 4'-phosphopantetheinyl transferase [Nocardia donostiensis]OQS13753.1 4'-phosphopantetheinyl transferase [Nocardia donostiensis]OQS22575.1 4'-phosphopantetheinyl transferase [Nocardia donostiensis]